MIDANPPPGSRLTPRARLPFEKDRLSIQGGLKSAGGMLYAALALICAGAALYMGLAVRHPVLSAYVMAPAIGAVWFAARLVMMISSKRRVSGPGFE